MVWLIVIGSVLAFALIFTPSRKTIVRSCREFDRIVATNCEENELECKRRMKAVMEAVYVVNIILDVYIIYKIK